MKYFLIKTKNKLHIGKYINVNFDIREYRVVLLKLCIEMKQLKQKY